MGTIAHEIILNEQGTLDVPAIMEAAIREAPLIDWPSESERQAISVRHYLSMSPYSYDERFNYAAIVEYLKTREPQEIAKPGVQE
jgi:hypothetical protein